MKKKWISLLLALCLLASVSFASAADSGDAVNTVRALGIMIGDENGDMRLNEYVTRAQFAKMLTAASVYRDTVSPDGAGYSLYRDVKNDHWASEYIRIAAQEGWMNGYTDGTFRPDNTITLEEVCAATLRLLGYDAKSLAGSFPYAQLSKASALGLRDRITLTQGGLMSRLDCAFWFTNLMTAQNASGQLHATALGYSVVNGSVDFTSAILKNVCGPYVATGGDALPFTPLIVYRGGTRSASAVLNPYDVYYYDESLGTLWIYTERAAGKISALSPSSAAPSAVTVGGITYKVGSSAATYQLSALNGVGTGDTVMLLLGIDDAVVGVVTGDAIQTTYYGMVLSCMRGLDSDDAEVQNTVTVFCSDGATRTFSVNRNQSFSAGNTVIAEVTGNGTTLRRLPSKSIGGAFSADGKEFAGYRLADDVKILDVTDEGNAVCVNGERLAACRLSSKNVRYYALNEKGEIAHLILDNVTGDAWTYGYLMYESGGVYACMVDGQSVRLGGNGAYFTVNVGAFAAYREESGAPHPTYGLASASLTAINATAATEKGGTLRPIADGVQVYVRRDGQFYAAKLKDISPETHLLTGWYDNFGCIAGGQIRVIVAEELN